MILAPFKRASDFVPEGLDFTKWSALEPLYRELIDRELHCVRCLEALIMDRSELDAAASEAMTTLEIEMTCNTSDERAAGAYAEFMAKVRPELRRVAFALDRKIASAPQVRDLDPVRYGVLLRAIRGSVELFREDNVMIEARLSELDQEYTRISGAMVVEFAGQTLPLSSLAKFSEDQDRSVRQAAFLAGAERRAADADALNALFEQMIPRRQQMARNAGCAGFADYMFKAKHRFDYTPEHCHAFAKGVAEHVTPLLRERMQARRRSLGVETLRPWDALVDVHGRPPLRPFQTADQLMTGVSRMIHRMDPKLGGLFDALQDDSGHNRPRCLDLDARPGKAPGGYLAFRERMRLPFIFMNAAGIQRDVDILLHEAGHALHALLTRDEPLLAYRTEVPVEFAEVASTAMELLGHDTYDEFYSPADARRVSTTHIETLLGRMATVAVGDQFQHRLYATQGIDRHGLSELWLELMHRYGPGFDWSGHEHLERVEWHRILHFFGLPFYFIEYGFAQLAALQIWLSAKSDRAGAIKRYTAALSLGGSKPLPELFAAAGVPFDVGPAQIGRVMEAVRRELESMG